MNNLSLTLGAAIAVSFALAMSTPVVAAPRVAPLAVQSSPDLVDAQYRGRERGERWRHGRFERRGGWGYYGGHRGFRDHRPGYRLHNGWWFPPAAFGLMVETRPAPRVGNAHVRWCYDRWKSYRAYDNSYQPTNGPRRQCVSPYG